MNDEARMTNDELMPKLEAPHGQELLAVAAGVRSGFRHLSFGFHSSFVIRISSFTS
ncbi:MAG TPA: hypothetical protein VH227_03105 [Candidatus Udaeobacter sp.]|nr:hypothetical protein [Candidatus Udaeobacter sp.]